MVAFDQGRGAAGAAAEADGEGERNGGEVPHRRRLCARVLPAAHQGGLLQASCYTFSTSNWIACLVVFDTVIMSDHLCKSGIAPCALYADRTFANSLDVFAAACISRVSLSVSQSTLGPCRAHNAPFACGRLHFRRLLFPWTDVGLGNCSYLDTCRHMHNCKFVHYELDSVPEAGGGARQNRPPVPPYLKVLYVPDKIHLFGVSSYVLHYAPLMLDASSRSQQVQCDRFTECIMLSPRSPVKSKQDPHFDSSSMVT